MKRQGQASNSSGLGRIAPCRIQIRQGATIVQSQEDDGAECQSWSNRALCIARYPSISVLQCSFSAVRACGNITTCDFAATRHSITSRSRLLIPRSRVRPPDGPPKQVKTANFGWPSFFVDLSWGRTRKGAELRKCVSIYQRSAQGALAPQRPPAQQADPLTAHPKHVKTVNFGWPSFFVDLSWGRTRKGAELRNLHRDSLRENTAKAP